MRLHVDRLAVDHQRAGDRHAFAQHLVDEDGQHRAKETAENAAASAENGRAADDDGRNHDQLGAEPALRRGALVLRDGHQSGDGRAERGEEIGAHAHPPCRDAGIDRRQLVAAGGERLVAPARLGKHDRAERDDEERERNLIVESEGVELAELEEPVKVARLDGIEDRLAAGQPEDEAAPDEEHGQRGDEGRHPEHRDEHAVDQAYQRAERQAGDDRRHDAHVVMVRIEDIGEGNADQPVGRPDREIEVLVGDHERHADRHDRVARGVAQQRLERVGREEEGRVDEGADDVEQAHHHDEPHLPAAEELHRAASERQGFRRHRAAPFLDRGNTDREGAWAPSRLRAETRIEN